MSPVLQATSQAIGISLPPSALAVSSSAARLGQQICSRSSIQDSTWTKDADRPTAAPRPTSRLAAKQPEAKGGQIHAGMDGNTYHPTGRVTLAADSRNGVASNIAANPLPRLGGSSPSDRAGITTSPDRGCGRPRIQLPNDGPSTHNLLRRERVPIGSGLVRRPSGAHSGTASHVLPATPMTRRCWPRTSITTTVLVGTQQIAPRSKNST
jgi:hypothetical protein